jgi:hypothetical protein
MQMVTATELQVQQHLPAANPLDMLQQAETVMTGTPLSI